MARTDRAPQTEQELIKEILSDKIMSAVFTQMVAIQSKESLEASIDPLTRLLSLIESEALTQDQEAFLWQNIYRNTQRALMMTELALQAKEENATEKGDG
jgi:hypothetical protein